MTRQALNQLTVNDDHELRSRELTLIRAYSWEATLRLSSAFTKETRFKHQPQEPLWLRVGADL